MQVQKKLAGSPDFLVDGSISMRKSPEVSSQRKSPSENVLESQTTLIDKPKNSSQKPIFTTNFPNEDSFPKLPLHSLKTDGFGAVTHKRETGLHSVPASAASAPMSVKSSSWCNPPPGNQWLVPVMSPSEGLVYKPYSGPYPPPSSSFMAPVYSSSKPLASAEGNGDYLGTIHGVPALHQGVGILPGTPPLAHTYLPPYGLPVSNSSVLGSMAEQTCSLPTLQLNGYDIGFRIEDFGSTFLHHSPSKVSKAVSSKEGETQGSTPSSPCREKGETLILFPITPSVQESKQDSESDKSDQKRVIRVVPRDPRSATESAARIFQSIQEERKWL